MKTITKITKKDGVNSDTALKRVAAIKLDVAALSESLEAVKTDACRDRELQHTSLQGLDERMTALDSVMQTVGGAIGQCQTVILSFKDTIEAQAPALESALRNAEQEHRAQAAAFGERLNVLDESLRSTDERATACDRAMQTRLERLEERLPLLEADMKALTASVGRIEQYHQRVNTRITAVMRMSMAIMGVLVVAAAVLGLLLFRK